MHMIFSNHPPLGVVADDSQRQCLGDVGCLLMSASAAVRSCGAGNPCCESAVDVARAKTSKRRVLMNKGCTQDAMHCALAMGPINRPTRPVPR